MAKWGEHVTLSAQCFQSEGLTAPRRVFPLHGQHLPPTAVWQITPNLVAQNYTSWSSDAQWDGSLCSGLSLSRGPGENIFHVHSGGWQNAILCSFTTEEPVPLLAVSPGLPACPINPPVFKLTPASNPWHPLDTSQRNPSTLQSSCDSIRSLQHDQGVTGSGHWLGHLWGPLENFASQATSRLPSAPPLPNQGTVICLSLLARHPWPPIAKPRKPHSMFRHCDGQTETAFQEVLCLAQELLCEHMLSYERLWFLYLN